MNANHTYKNISEDIVPDGKIQLINMGAEQFFDYRSYSWLITNRSVCFAPLYRQEFCATQLFY